EYCFRKNHERHRRKTGQLAVDGGAVYSQRYLSLRRRFNKRAICADRCALFSVCTHFVCFLMMKIMFVTTRH
ncbi:hypothetical protein IscW_ISCW012173, partial [Ixodes scapularis]